jgi:hypothetical protein
LQQGDVASGEPAFDMTKEEADVKELVQDLKEMTVENEERPPIV